MGTFFKRGLIAGALGGASAGVSTPLLIAAFNFWSLLVNWPPQDSLGGFILGLLVTMLFSAVAAGVIGSCLGAIFGPVLFLVSRGARHMRTPVLIACASALGGLVGVAMGAGHVVSQLIFAGSIIGCVAGCVSAYSFNRELAL